MFAEITALHILVVTLVILRLQAQLQGQALQSGESSDQSTDSIALTQSKEAAEQAIEQLLEKAKANLRHKLQLTNKRQQQKEYVLEPLLHARQTFADLHSSCSPASWAESVSAVRERNAVHLQASLALAAAFKETQEAKACLQQCLQKEQSLLDCLEGPLQLAVGQSLQLVQSTASMLQQDNPQRELRHTEELLRYHLL